MINERTTDVTNPVKQMTRAELRAVIVKAAVAAGCEPDDRERLCAAADQTTHVAVGAFDLDLRDDELGIKCGCPATIAGYWDGKACRWRADTPLAVKNFPGAFDSSRDLRVVDSATGSEVWPDVIEVTA